MFIKQIYETRELMIRTHPFLNMNGEMKEYKRTSVRGMRFNPMTDDLLYLNFNPVELSQKEIRERTINHYDRKDNYKIFLLNGSKGGCRICGESGNVIKREKRIKHTAKCCPYFHYFDIQSITEKDFFLNVMEEFSNENLGAMDKEFINMNNTMNDLSAEIASVKKENITILNCFSKDEIVKRKKFMIMEKGLIGIELKNFNQYRLKENERQEIKAIGLNIKECLLKDKEIETETNKKLITELQEEIKIFTKIKELKDNKLELLKTKYMNNVKQYNRQEEENKRLKNTQSQLCEQLQRTGVESNLLTYIEDDCPICCEKIDDGFGTTTPCKHTFHSDCYTKFICSQIKQKSYGRIECPMCRNNLYDI